MGSRLNFVLRAAVMAAAFLVSPHAYAKPADDKPVYMTADKMGYDQKNGIVIAIGNVEVVQGGYVLMADRIDYYQQQNMVRAHGNITLLQPDGNVVFAEEAQLKDDLKSGVIENFRARLSDNSLFAAREAQRPNDHTIVMKKAVYSPCKICRDVNGTAKDPLWQIKANEVTYEEDAQRIVYDDAFLELYGVPVLYTPYLSHPSPNADRKSGLLLPEYSHSSMLGAAVKLPYYINIAPDKDATITPYMTSREGLVMEGEYRQLTDSGSFQFNGSATYPEQRDALGNEIDGHEFRGHIFARGNSGLSEHWSYGFDVNRASDDTYLRRYDFGNQDTLTSRLYTERIEDRDYVNIQGLAFQGLREEDDPDRSPVVLPSVDVHVESDPLWKGSRASFTANALAVSREIGKETRRVVMEGEVKTPLISKYGHVIETDLALRADGYSVDDVEINNGTDTFDGNEKRVIPRAGVTWRYPMITYVNDTSLVLEPIAQVVASTNGNNPETIPNEDSQLFDFSDVNLFAYNRQVGWDRVDNGTRAVYGLRGEAEFPGEHYLNFLVGQDYSLSGDAINVLGTSSSDDFSDYVGQVGYESGMLNVDYRVWLREDDLALRRNEISGVLTTRYLDLYSDYIYLNEDPVLEDLNEIFVGGNLRVNENWSLNGFVRRDLESKDDTRAAGGGVVWQNECVTIFTGVTREFFRDRDIQPDTSVSVRVGLKNLN